MRPVALVLGGATTVWADFEKARKLVSGRKYIVVAANDAGWAYDGHLDGWATLHPEMFQPWRDDREARGLNDDYRAFVHDRPRRGEEVLKMRWSGSSGLFAAQVAVDAMGAAGAILCGVPIEAEAGHFAEAGEWALFERYRPAFLAAAEQGFPVRSMSGWSAEALGQPTKAWLEDIGAAKGRRTIPRPKEATVRIKMKRTRNFTAPEERRVTTKYLADGEYTVKRAWGEQMVKDGDAAEIEAPASPQSSKPAGSAPGRIG